MILAQDELQITSPKQGDGTPAPATLYRRVLGRSKLSNNEKAVAKAIAKDADYGTGGNSYPGNKRIAQKTGLSEITVKRITAKLRKLGWLKQVRAGHGALKLAAVWQLQIPLQIKASSVPKVSPPKYQKDTSPHSLQNGVTEDVPADASTPQPVDIERNLLDAGIQAQRDLIERMRAAHTCTDQTWHQIAREDRKPTGVTLQGCTCTKPDRKRGESVDWVKHKLFMQSQPDEHVSLPV